MVAIIGCVLSVIIPMISKYFTSDTEYPGIFKRPDGARDCNLFNTGGICDHESGFPSGHVTLISYFCFYMFHLYKGNVYDHIYGYTDIEQRETNRRFYDDYYYLKELSVFFLFSIPILMMGYARYMKKCHNMVQVIAGAFTGYIISSSIVQVTIH